MAVASSTAHDTLSGNPTGRRVVSDGRLVADVPQHEGVDTIFMPGDGHGIVAIRHEQGMALAR